jgi:hypothetical protein
VLVVCVVILSPLVFALSEVTQLNPELTLAERANDNAEPLQTLVETVLVMTGIGFTVTVVIVLLTVFPVCVVVLSPVVLALLFETQLYVAAMLLVRPKFKATPLQTVVVEALVITGNGLTVTVAVFVALQLEAVPVTV